MSTLSVAVVESKLAAIEEWQDSIFLKDGLPSAVLINRQRNLPDAGDNPSLCRSKAVVGVAAGRVCVHGTSPHGKLQIVWSNVTTGSWMKFFHFEAIDWI